MGKLKNAVMDIMIASADDGKEITFEEAGEILTARMQAKCTHKNKDGSICEDCGKDCAADMQDAADFARDCLENR